MAISRSWQNLKDFLRKTYNREVNEWFRDEPDPLPDNSTSRKQAKRACLITSKDSQNMTLLKTLTFRYVVQRVHLVPDVYGTPIGNFDPVRKYKPQVFFEFLEDELDIEGGYSRVAGRFSYRLMDESSETISRTELTAIANRIKTEFGAGNGYIWRKGKDLASYIHKNRGYNFQLLVRSKTDAKAIITKVLSTNNEVPNWKYLSYKEADNPSETYPTVPVTKTILNKTYREPRIRPIADVRFQYAYCTIWGKSKPVILFDRSLRYLNAIVQ